MRRRSKVLIYLGGLQHSTGAVGVGANYWPPVFLPRNPAAVRPAASCTPKHSCPLHASMLRKEHNK